MLLSAGIEAASVLVVSVAGSTASCWQAHNMLESDNSATKFRHLHDMDLISFDEHRDEKPQAAMAQGYFDRSFSLSADEQQNHRRALNLWER
jgi:hypothetical protein